MVDELTLHAITVTTGANGFPTTTTTSTTVYADAQSVKRAEYYAANAAGQRVDRVFVVNADEYAGQTEVVHLGVTHKVIRTYQVGWGRVELTCARK